MTFSVSKDQGAFEWSGTSLSALFAQKSNIFTLRMWQLIFDIVRFNQFALDLLRSEPESEIDPSGANGSASIPSKGHNELSIGKYLNDNNYSETFRNDYLVPMTACVWSTNPDKVNLDFPAITLIRFLWNHHLLNTVTARPKWLTIPGGTKQYVEAVLADFPPERIHLNSTVTSLHNNKDGTVTIQLQNGQEESFDHVILATHGDQAREIIRKSATKQELDIMSAFETSANTAVLHTDESLMPRRSIAWASWNYLTRTTTTTTGSPSSSSNTGIPSSVCLTYSMNILQHIDYNTHGPVLVTLNPLHEPNPSTVQGRWTYHHPLYNAAAIRAQSLLPRIQNTRAISYTGAWTKYGFHEDGFSSGLKVAIEHLGAELPFEFVDSTFSRGRRPVLGWLDWVLRGVLMVVQGWVVVLSWVFGMVWGEPSKAPMGLGRTNGHAVNGNGGMKKMQ